MIGFVKRKKTFMSGLLNKSIEYANLHCYNCLLSITLFQFLLSNTNKLSRKWSFTMEGIFWEFRQQIKEFGLPGYSNMNLTYIMWRMFKLCFLEELFLFVFKRVLVHEWHLSLNIWLKISMYWIVVKLIIEW